MDSVKFRLDLMCDFNGMSKKENSFISDTVESIPGLNKEKLLSSSAHDFITDCTGLCLMELQGKKYTPLCGYINQEVINE